jgi:hypothetical protein
MECVELGLFVGIAEVLLLEVVVVQQLHRKVLGHFVEGDNRGRMVVVDMMVL